MMMALLMAIVEWRDEGRPFDDGEVVVRVKAPFAQRRGPTISVALCSRHAVASRRVSHVRICDTFQVSSLESSRSRSAARGSQPSAFPKSKFVYCSFRFHGLYVERAPNLRFAFSRSISMHSRTSDHLYRPVATLSAAKQLSEQSELVLFEKLHERSRNRGTVILNPIQRAHISMSLPRTRCRCKRSCTDPTS